jgi:AcrR family transcriptional regulator
MADADPPRRRTRLAPEVRRNLILEEAARIVLEEGVSAVSMERLGRAAGVSKALVYNYFPNRNALLSALLLGEYGRFRETGRRLIGTARDFPTLVRATTRAYLDHVAERGLLIQRLANEPAVAASIRPVDAAGRSETADFFGRRIAERYGLPLDQATMAADILMGLTGAAGDYLVRNGRSADDIEELTVRMILAALDGIAPGPIADRDNP